MPDPVFSYYVRRHLNYGMAEWDALPWYEQRCYTDGLHEEFFGGAPARVQHNQESDDVLRQLGIRIIHQ